MHFILFQNHHYLEKRCEVKPNKFISVGSIIKKKQMSRAKQYKTNNRNVFIHCRFIISQINN